MRDTKLCEKSKFGKRERGDVDGLVGERIGKRKESEVERERERERER